MSQLYKMPPSEFYTPAPRRHTESNLSFVIGLGVASLVIVGIAGALIWTGVLYKPASASYPSNQGAPLYLTTSVGQPLTVSNVTVTLSSAAVTSTTQETQAGQPTLVASLVLHFANQTTSNQTVSMEKWQFVDSAGNSYPIIPMSSAHLTLDLAPNATLDQQFVVPMTVGGSSPYTLATDVTTSDGMTLGWTFTH